MEARMTDNTTLDAAIEAACKQMWPTSFDGNITNSSRTYARALIAKLLEGMDGRDTRVLSEIHPAAVVWGYNAALAEIRRRAGLEGLS
jgi:hypothetical protein